MTNKNVKYFHAYKTEVRAKKHLESEGYLAIRAAGSHGPFDVIGISPIDIRLVQIKLTHETKLPSYKSVVDELAKIQVPANARKELWVWEHRNGWHFYQCP
jgi:Holliday junction resolvase